MMHKVIPTNTATFYQGTELCTQPTTQRAIARILILGLSPFHYDIEQSVEVEIHSLVTFSRYSGDGNGLGSSSARGTLVCSVVEIASCLQNVHAQT